MVLRRRSEMHVSFSSGTSYSIFLQELKGSQPVDPTTPICGKDDHLLGVELFRKAPSIDA